MRAVRAVPGAIVVLLSVSASCTQVSDRDRFEAESTPLRILRTVPASGAVDVASDLPIAVCLSELVDPRSIAPSDTSVSSGPALFDTELSIQLLPWTGPDGGPVPAMSEAPWCSGSVLSVTPQTELTAGAQYRLQLQPTARGWGGEPIDTDRPGWVAADGEAPRFFVEFTVAAQVDPDDDADDDPAPTLTELFAAGGPFDPERANCSCHRDPDDLAFARLDLTDATTAFDGLVGASGPRDTGFAMVAPRDPSQSFVMHKLLRGRDGGPLHGVLGDAMPIGEPLPYPDLVAIARWIEGGAAL